MPVRVGFVGAGGIANAHMNALQVVEDVQIAAVRDVDRKRSRLVAVVQGRVQGVGFRYFVIDRALELRLTGVCRNLRNGDVEVVAEGEQGALEALLASLHAGPRMAYVEKVHAVWSPATGEFTTFTIAPTR
jgi:acylphosphatase